MLIRRKRLVNLPYQPARGFNDFDERDLCEDERHLVAEVDNWYTQPEAQTAIFAYIETTNTLKRFEAEMAALKDNASEQVKTIGDYLANAVMQIKVEIEDIRFIAVTLAENAGLNAKAFNFTSVDDAIKKSIPAKDKTN